MLRNPERLAWTVLVISFVACVALAVSTPLVVRAFLMDSTDPAVLILKVQQGTALLRRPASTDVVGVTDVTTDVPEGSAIKADASTQAILTMRDRNAPSDLAIAQLYANTELTVLTASSPRFGASPNPHQFGLFMGSGRIRINVLDDTSRPVVARLRAPQGEVTFAPGTYAVEVSNQELQVTARDGSAVVSAQGTEVVIGSLERARVALGQPPQGGLSNERNLVADGNFTGSPADAWLATHDLQDETEAPGRTIYTTVAGRQAAEFMRDGRSHAETRLEQDLNRDVTEAASLTLHFAVRVDRQDIPICGTLGSECPLMARIDYRDTSGSEREWVQGFYSAAALDPQNVNPRFCVTCSTRNAHRPVVPATWFAFDSGNLMNELVVDGFRPAWIDRISFYASGHSYQSAITDVELLVRD